MNYLALLILSLTDWVLTKIALFLGATEGNPVVGWVGGIDNGLILKIVGWAIVVVLVPIANFHYPKMGNRILKGAVLFYACICLWNAYQIGWPIL